MDRICVSHHLPEHFFSSNQVYIYIWKGLSLIWYRRECPSSPKQMLFLEIKLYQIQPLYLIISSCESYIQKSRSLICISCSSERDNFSYLDIFPNHLFLCLQKQNKKQKVLYLIVLVFRIYKMSK